MPITPRSVRLLASASAVCVVAAGLTIRVVGSGSLEQYSGTALYAAMVYTGVLLLWPRISPLPAGGIAVGFCWLVEVLQLTGVPAALSARSLLARLVLGAQFDLTDVAWYPVGVVPLVALDWLLRGRTRTERNRGAGAVAAGTHPAATAPPSGDRSPDRLTPGTSA
ncbi:DUF2809 domain-containing protein [Planosporangium sp. 12N6]|uniref:ribosomal maturation YjgA family protein n=1 Tax=Planosporangium spinosum TaxID=3402278 RepID=UPI003CF3F3B9